MQQNLKQHLVKVSRGPYTRLGGSRGGGGEVRRQHKGVTFAVCIEEGFAGASRSGLIVFRRRLIFAVSNGCTRVSPGEPRRCRLCVLHPSALGPLRLELGRPDLRCTATCQVKRKCRRRPHGRRPRFLELCPPRNVDRYEPLALPG